MGKKVLVAMSGGVDSSVVAALLQKQGFDVAGITMRVIDASNGKDPVIEAKQVADKLGIEHYVIDAVEFFHNTVIDYFINDYLKGSTPNPCICCNQKLKFGLLLNKSCEMGYDFFATGHYATIKDGYLYRGVDTTKDQSYFLYPIYKCDYSRVLFPLGNLTKESVRKLAEQYGLQNANKRESQDICFIGTGGYTDFLKQRCENDFLPGPILDVTGRVIGKHYGIQGFTIGQRKGLGALGKPMYVKEILPKENSVVAATDEELMVPFIRIKETVLSPAPIDITRSYSVQVRYRSQAVSCHLENLGANSMKVNFGEPVRAIAPGQSAVIYDGDRVIGAGVICSEKE